MANPYQPLSSIQGLYQSLSTVKPKPVIKASPMGVPAQSPNSNVAAAINSLPVNQTQRVDTNTSSTTPAMGGPSGTQTTPTAPTTPPVAPPVTPTNQTTPVSTTPTNPTGQTPPPQGGNPYPGYVNQLGNFSNPAYDQANNNLLDFQKKYADYQTAVGTEANPFGFETGVGQLAANRYSQLLPAYQQAVSNALAGGQQKLGAIQSATSASQPTQVSPGNFFVSPVSGNDVSGGSISPGIGGARQAQVSQGNQGQLNKPLLDTANTYVQNLNSLVSTAGLNSNDLNAFNWLSNVGAQNSSNPLAPRIQATFNGVLAQYAQVLGVTPQSLVSTLTPIAQGSTITDFMNYLSNYAATYNQNLIRSSTSNSPSPSPTNISPTTVTPSQPQSFTRPNGQVVHLQADGTYQ